MPSRSGSITNATMIARSTINRTLWHKTAVTAALLALVLRALIPVGWMPDTSATTHKFTFVLCTGHGARIVTLGADGKTHPVDDPAKVARAHAPCAFSVLLAPVLPAETVAFTLPPAIRDSQVPIERLLPSTSRSILAPTPRGPPILA